MKLGSTPPKKTPTYDGPAQPLWEAARQLSLGLVGTQDLPDAGMLIGTSQTASSWLRTIPASDPSAAKAAELAGRLDTIARALIDAPFDDWDLPTGYRDARQQVKDVMHAIAELE